jgi:hypothetical protein
MITVHYADAFPTMRINAVVPGYFDAEGTLPW